MFFVLRVRESGVRIAAIEIVEDDDEVQVPDLRISG